MAASFANGLNLASGVIWPSVAGAWSFVYHHHTSPTHIALRFSVPAQDMKHLERVASERLERVTLAAPVIRLSLEARRLDV